MLRLIGPGVGASASGGGCAQEPLSGRKAAPVSAAKTDRNPVWRRVAEGVRRNGTTMKAAIFYADAPPVKPFTYNRPNPLMQTRLMTAQASMLDINLDTIARDKITPQ